MSKDAKVESNLSKDAKVESTKDANTVFIGNKPVMNYVLAIITLLGSGNVKEVVLKARGRAISTTVDVAEIVKRRFVENLKVSKVSIGTEEIPSEEGRPRAVSTMEITLKKED